EQGAHEPGQQQPTNGISTHLVLLCSRSMAYLSRPWRWRTRIWSRGRAGAYTTLESGAAPRSAYGRYRRPGCPRCIALLCDAVLGHARRALVSCAALKAFSWYHGIQCRSDLAAHLEQRNAVYACDRTPFWFTGADL